MENILKRGIGGVRMQEPQSHCRLFQFPRVNRFFKRLRGLHICKCLPKESAYSSGKRTKVQLEKKSQPRADIERLPPFFFRKREKNRRIAANFREHLAELR